MSSSPLSHSVIPMKFKKEIIMAETKTKAVKAKVEKPVDPMKTRWKLNL